MSYAEFPPAYETVASNRGLHMPNTATVYESPAESSSQAPAITESQVLKLTASYFPPIPPHVRLPLLPKPVLIPRINPGSLAPFVRAWAPELAHHAITREDLVAFIDNLNLVLTPHPAIHVVELASLGVHFAPTAAASGISAAMHGMAILATHAIGHQRTQTFLSTTNDNYFHPRQLHAEIIDSKRMKEMFHLDEDDPLTTPLSEDSLDSTMQERCLKYLSRWACELSFDGIPPPSPQTSVLERVAAWSVEHKIAKAEKKAKKKREKAWKKHLKGKKSKEGKAEKRRAKSLDWILIRNLSG
ncbi:uncharacterized protein GGS25DRAFT_504654 [Hypoxylon fragiforme]|uniref:uncharacterized protein n=1 Tax=Hypoxylon fragiforme TaxID=63214 RepID=UPI0020C6E3D9|nr:uncharacterized protein GGS25DRAFT_504654 [Hypoxylon fragiforme]KAI2605312.1 hypothetical protein GGS25DRAFT_504654 [Hypoxylon fragiforme]